MAKQEKPHPYPPGLPSSFCYLPWVQFGTTVGGFPRLCANTPSLRDESGERLQVSCSLGVDEVWNGEQMKAIRRQMISGQLPEICRRCSDMESSGLESKRLKMIHLKPEWAGDPKDLLRETGEDGHLQAGPRSFNLRLGNVCNLKCVMCRPDFSSKWQGDFTRLFTEGLAIPLRLRSILVSLAKASREITVGTRNLGFLSFSRVPCRRQNSSIFRAGSP